MTAIPLGGSRTWRSAIVITAGLLVTTAAIARDRLVATAATPRDAGIDGTVGTVSLHSPAVSDSTDPNNDVGIAHSEPDVRERALVGTGGRVPTGQVRSPFESEQERREIERLRVEAADAKDETVQLRSTLDVLERAMATAAEMNAHTAAELANTERLVEQIPHRVNVALESAQTAYDAAIGRERRAAALAAHGVFAREELEQAQLEVRAAANDLETARRAADAEAALAAVRSLRARTEGTVALADMQRQLEQRRADLIQAERRLRTAEMALKKASAPLFSTTKN